MKFNAIAYNIDEKGAAKRGVHSQGKDSSYLCGRLSLTIRITTVSITIKAIMNVESIAVTSFPP